MQTVPAKPRKRVRSRAEKAFISLAAVTALAFIGVPISVIFVYAFRAGFEVYLANILEPNTLHAIGLTVLTAIVVGVATLGVAIAILRRLQVENATIEDRAGSPRNPAGDRK